MLPAFDEFGNLPPGELVSVQFFWTGELVAVQFFCGNK